MPVAFQFGETEAVIVSVVIVVLLVLILRAVRRIGRD